MKTKKPAGKLQWRTNGRRLRHKFKCLKLQRLDLEKQMHEELQYMRDANRDEMDNQDIYESMSGIFEDKMRAYDSKFYEIDVQINGLEFKLKNIENNN